MLSRQEELLPPSFMQIVLKATYICHEVLTAYLTSIELVPLLKVADVPLNVIICDKNDDGNNNDQLI